MIDWIGMTIPFIALLFFASLTVLVLKYARSNRAAQAFVFFLSAHVIWSFGSLFWHLTAGMFWNRILVTGTVLVAASLVYFTTEFLDLKRRMSFYAAEVAVLVVLGLIWAGLVTTDSYMEQGIARMSLGPGFPFLVIVLEGIYVWSIVRFVQQYRRASDSIFRYRIQYLIAGLSLQALGGMFNGVPGIGHLPIDIALAALNASLIAIAIFRHHLLDITVALRRSLGYSILTVGITATFLLSAF